MRAWFSGRIPAFQAGEESSILSARTKKTSSNGGFLRNEKTKEVVKEFLFMVSKNGHTDE